ncbi:hypothetical protein CEG18_11905 [Pseudomonas nitroreducens]|uniref:Transcriptional regulator n=1 Tax=Pseudomonas nitroreducens TaxID=46680 RepID=A0A2D0ADU6_PSENT|nr:hypothetical protein CEG18_11905 [Pseudomonas nitroreducens]
MELAAYIRSLDRPKDPTSNPLEQFATRCGVTVGYMRIHVLHARKDPRFRLLRALARESQGMVSLAEVLQHFGVPSEETLWPIAA